MDRFFMSFYLEAGLRHQIAVHLSSLSPSSHVWLIDEKVHAHFPDLGVGEKRLILPSGEETKSLSQAASCWQQLMDFSLDRQSVLIAVGGGVTGDLVGFLASTLFRGIRWMHVPTTLLAMIDASIGGKTALNFHGRKNSLGTFHPSERVLTDPEFLHTLPHREFCAGIAEGIKSAVILDRTLFQWLEQSMEALLQRSSPLLSTFIQRCQNLKQSVITRDPKDTQGIRALLNWGHTIGHGVEALSGYRYLHGEAVSIGMCCAAWISEKLAFCSPQLPQRQKQLLQRAQLPTDFPCELSPQQVLQSLYHDKKTSRGKLHFVLAQELGKGTLATVPPNLILESMQC